MGKQLIENVGRKTVFMVPADRLVVIGLDTKDGPEHRLWDERIHAPIDDAMVASIASLGVKQTISVEVDGDQIIVVDGRRRVIHARVANAKLIKAGDAKAQILVPCMVEKGDEKVAELAMVALNEIRMEDPLVVKASKAIRMLARGHAKSDVAKAFGVDPQTITMWESFSGLSTPVKAAVTDGKISATAATKLAPLAKVDQEKELSKLLTESGGKKVTVASANAATKAVKNGGDKMVAPSKRDLRKAIENGVGVLSDDMIRGMRIAIGDLDPKAVAGLTALLRGETPEA